MQAQCEARIMSHFSDTHFHEADAATEGVCFNRNLLAFRVQFVKETRKPRRYSFSQLRTGSQP
jgi:hypothetical protein